MLGKVFQYFRGCSSKLGLRVHKHTVPTHCSLQVQSHAVPSLLKINVLAIEGQHTFLKSLQLLDTKLKTERP